MKQEGKRRRYSYNCSFCGRSQDQAQRLIAGPGFVYICDECIDFIYSGDGTYLEGKSMFYLPVQAADKREQRCSFCGKAQHDVRYIAAKAQTDRHICNECIDLCREIIEEEQRTITQRPDSTTEGS